ncbi:MAG: hypothetical protein ABIS20_01235 [Thermoanaerobaculia bacterium]
MTLTRMLFDLGRVVATPGALAVLEESGEDPHLYLGRHVTGDWGEISSVDTAANMLALGIGDRLISSYRTSQGAKLLVATESDRSVTCLFLPEDY